MVIFFGGETLLFYKKDDFSVFEFMVGIWILDSESKIPKKIIMFFWELWIQNTDAILNLKYKPYFFLKINGAQHAHLCVCKILIYFQKVDFLIVLYKMLNYECVLICENKLIKKVKISLLIWQLGKKQNFDFNLGSKMEAKIDKNRR